MPTSLKQIGWVGGKGVGAPQNQEPLFGRVEKSTKRKPTILGGSLRQTHVICFLSSSRLLENE